MSTQSFSVTNCPFKTKPYRDSGILPACKRSIFFMLVFPNVTCRSPLSSRDRT